MYPLEDISLEIVSTADVLRAYLQHTKLEDRELLDSAYQIAARYRIDLLDVMMEFLTWETFAGDKRFDEYVISVVDKDYVGVMSFLLDKGLSSDYEARVNRHGVEHCCILYHACKFHQNNIAKLLLSRGADVNKKTWMGSTPAFGAATYGNIDILNILYLYGADFQHRRTDGGTLWTVLELDHYYLDGPMVEFLLITDVPLNRRDYDSIIKTYMDTGNPYLRDPLEIMRNLLIKQGEDVEEIIDYESDGDGCILF